MKSGVLVDVVYNNTFDSCKITRHPDDPLYRVLSCRNIMNEVDNHFIFEHQFAMCKNHFCAIVQDTTDLSHKILTCSGAILEFNKESFFNAINTNKPIFNELIAFPYNAVEFLGTNFRYYYLKDSRSFFSQNIMAVNCTNDYMTCLTFETNSVCIGNVNDIRIIHDLSSFILGVVVATFLSTLVYLTINEYSAYFRNIISLIMYIFPLVSMGLILQSAFALTLMAYIIGNVFVIILFPLVINYIEGYFEKYMN